MGNTLDRSFIGNAEPSREVITKYGSLIGKRLVNDGDKRVDAFLGIPFAKAPLGELRFAKPVPPDPWQGVRKAESFGPRGMQKDMSWLGWMTKWKYGDTSEDNLYLNVFTPAWEPPLDGFPVMVFVHGGAFVSDSSVKYGDIGICKYLVPHGVVVVTIQYRLGYLGFFSTGDDACVDNLGLWDMTAALKWIAGNIDAFSGNKDNVTLFGQSAGGASVDLLSISPHSRDLFHKVIPMAGNACCSWAICTEAVERCREFGAANGIEVPDTSEFIAKMRKLPAVKFATSMQASLAKVGVEIGPRLDGDFLPSSPAELRASAPQKPTLIGTCQCEGLLFCASDKKSSTFSRLEQMIAELIPEQEFPDFKAVRAECLRLYLDPDYGVHDKQKVQLAIANLYSDKFLNTATQKCALQKLHLGSENTYLYSFDYFNPKSWGLFGLMLPFKAPTHCTELAYLFNVGIIMNFTFNDDDYIMLDIMTKLWTNFAKYGNPNGNPEGDREFPFVWEPVSAEHPFRCLSIKPDPEMKEEYGEGRPKFWLRISNKSSEESQT